MNIAAMLELDRAAPERSSRRPAGTEARGRVLSLIGSGGKTTLLWHLAQAMRSKRALAATTTRMFRESPPGVRLYTDAAALPRPLPPGVHFVGTPLDHDKLGPLPAEMLAALLDECDAALVEADGSRGLPYKAWAEYEPVIPRSTDTTIIVIPAIPETPATPEYVHRLDMFLAVTGMQPGQFITPAHIARLMAHERGPMRAAQGRVVLFFNQAEDERALAFARESAALLPPACVRRMWKIMAGSARDGEATVIY